MSAAQKLIAEVLRGHQIRHDSFSQDWDSWYCTKCRDKGGWYRHMHAGLEHVAAEVDKALGGLAPQTRPVNLRCDCGNEADLSWCGEGCARFHPMEFEHGWVSGWTVTE